MSDASQRARLADHVPPELVIFDVDGTLHDTFRWWTPVIQAGIQRFAEQEGITLELPDQASAEAVVGNRDAGVWGPFLPDGMKDRWRDLRSVVIPMEVAEISRGVDYLFPGVRELLTHLREVGVAVALASNCRDGYFRGVKEGQGLGDLVDHAFCLDSEGVDSTTDMLRLARAAVGAGRVVMVGDRDADQDAAAAAQVPFLWRHNDRFPLDGVDGVWDGSPTGFCQLVGLPTPG